MRAICLHFRVTSLKLFSKKLRKEPTFLEKKTIIFRRFPPKVYIIEEKLPAILLVLLSGW